MPIEWLPPVLSALVKIPGLARFVGPLVMTRQLTRVADDLLSLRFWSEGTLEPLQKIAGGEGGSAEQAAILAKLDGSQASFVETIERLRSVRSFVAFQISVAAAKELDLIIYKRIGPDAIRPKLRDLAQVNIPSTTEATALIAEITEFNRTVGQLHDAIRKRANATAGTRAKK